MRRLLFLTLAVGLALTGGSTATAHPSNFDLGDTATTDNEELAHSFSFDCVPGESGGFRITITQEGGGKAKVQAFYTCGSGGSFGFNPYGTRVAAPFVEGPALARGVATSGDGGRVTAREIITVDVV
jgi:hypothetical protein